VYLFAIAPKMPVISALGTRVVPVMSPPVSDGFAMETPAAELGVTPEPDVLASRG
jgi:hypothetical protein